MSRPTKLSNSTKRKIRAQLTQERRTKEEASRRSKMDPANAWYAVKEEGDSPLELLGVILVILALPVMFGLATLIFGA